MATSYLREGIFSSFRKSFIGFFFVIISMKMLKYKAISITFFKNYVYRNVIYGSILDFYRSDLRIQDLNTKVKFIKIICKKLHFFSFTYLLNFESFLI